LQTNHDRENCDLYGQHFNLHSNNGRAQGYSETGSANISQQQIIASPKKMQIPSDQDQISWSCPITR